MGIIRQNDQLAVQFEAVEYRSLSDKVAAKLRDAIIEGRLAPGTKITESDLSTSLSVSRTVVREAIMMLVQEGLVVKAHNRYNMVALYSRRDIQEIYDMRAALELAGARICINRSTITDELIKKEERMLDIQRQENIDHLAFVYADMDFHTCIVQSSQNSRLIDAWHRILGPCLVSLYQYTLDSAKQSPLGKLTYYDHSAIIRAFASQNFRAVDVVLIEHVNIIKNILINLMDE